MNFIFAAIPHGTQSSTGSAAPVIFYMVFPLFGLILLFGIIVTNRLKSKQSRLNNRSSPAPLKSQDQILASTPTDSPFELLVELPVWDAQRLLARFEQEGVRFELMANNSQIQAIDAIAASNGGSYGRSSQIQIFTHQNDATITDKIWREFCNFEK